MFDLWVLLEILPIWKKSHRIGALKGSAPLFLRKSRDFFFFSKMLVALKTVNCFLNGGMDEAGESKAESASVLGMETFLLELSHCYESQAACTISSPTLPTYPEEKKSPWACTSFSGYKWAKVPICNLCTALGVAPFLRGTLLSMCFVVRRACSVSSGTFH